MIHQIQIQRRKKFEQSFSYNYIEGLLLDVISHYILVFICAAITIIENKVEEREVYDV